MRTSTKLFLLGLCLFASAAQAQYCMLPGRTSYDDVQPGITNFKLGTINRTSINVEQSLSQPPVVVTTDGTFLVRGQKYTVTIKHSRDSFSFPTAHNNIRVWIDYNGDKDFIDAGETVISKDMQTPGVFTDTFTVPVTAPLGATRLRATAKMASDAGHSIPTPCDDPADPIGYHGEMEDYTVNIVASAGINEAAQQSVQATVFPNPSSGTISVSLDNRNVGSLAIDLYDVAGRHITNLLPKTMTPAAEYKFNLEKHISSTGIFFIRLTSDGGSSYQKLIMAD
jgi:hypothetical protein